ncbi:16S rRNA (uracil(1498)-N(3))-methyltransferase [Domibacillus sp. PGB-M46]|uniref:16S rRNA (uracil(1498)-N(3))-methyltransferase n=1 Tax=Domibacillus sp. PGB-M46 TaxID=2910255 RepID=UPI001F57E766|nr:16S rRNA (uracil(1498)-N(3))-methyltransferase [Domibacillus sp. PGB-M46]MCI2254490.1 16S rRNA (uracil(1498)-N(3))-methyltransferase [Domibacillus sp. PGB-M46]
MQRYFLTSGQNAENIHFSKEDAHHIRRVMRMEEGDRVYAVFPEGEAGVAVLTSVTDTSVEARIEEWIEQSTEMPAEVVVACGLVKGDKFDYIIQKGTELGAAGFVPFEAERSIVKWDPKKGAKKTERWQKIAKEAAEQSHRNRIPGVAEPVSMKQMIEQSSTFDVKIFAYEETAKSGEMTAFYEAVHLLKPGGRMLVVTGPEGGFSEKEAAQLQDSGFIPCALGPRILRAETAPLYVLSAVSFYLELKR